MKRRIISFLLSFVMIFVFVLPINVLAAEENTKKYYGQGYEITYDIKSQWTGNQNVEVTIKNTGTESLLNWALKYDAHGEINGLWNGTVFSSESTKYIVKNAGYNYEIKPEQSVTFGYTLSGEYMGFPETIELCSQRTESNAEEYNVTMNITDDWDTGFIGNVTIENFSENPLEAWRLSFNTNFTIDDIWNAQILSSFENSYTIANDITTTPIGAGESKVFGFKATKESGVTPEMTDFVISEITVNDDFTTIDIPEITLAVSGFANYLEEENALNIFWYTNVENGRFELLESYNNEDFITTVILNNEYSYTYPITMDFDKRYFKVIQTTDDGQTAESPVFYVEKTEDGYSTKFIDSDEDGLPDFVEEQIGTDINNEDTDDDGLTDYQEYYILGTDPLVYDSVTEGVSDADADCDDDGLSNIREFELGTKPFNPDTDNDGLTDGDEVNIYGTDPLNYDTDNDGISDGDEVALGTDPLSSTTDGIADTERTFVQTIDADDEILDDINTEYNPYDLSLEITAAGNAHSSLTVQESGYSDAMFNWSILGVCPELNYDSACKVDEVVLKFKVDEEYIDNPDSEYAKENPEFVGIKRYNVFKFFEEDNILLPVKTDVDVENNTVSATVTDLGTYCLIDMESFLRDIVQGAEDSDIEAVSGGHATEMLGTGAFGMLKLTTSSVSTKVKPSLDYDDEFNVVFMYDEYAEGYSDFYQSVCDVTDFIFNKSVNANVYFVELEEPSCNLSYFVRRESPAGGYVDKDTYDFHDSFLRDRNFTDHKSSGSSKGVVVSDAFDFVVNGIRDRDGNYTEIVDTSLPTLCFSFFGDEGAVYRESTGYPLLDDLVSENVFVSLIGNYDFSTYVGGYAKDLYQQTGGKYFRMNGKNISDTLIRYIYEMSESEEIPDLDTKYPMILSTGLEYVELDAPITIEYFYAYSDITADNHNSSRFSGYADTDGDGLYDFEEINFSYDLIRRENGRVVLPTYGECIDKYSGLFYVEEGLDRYLNFAGYVELIDTKVLPIKSDPTRDNIDRDNYSDYEEIYAYETDPLRKNDIFYKSDIDYVTEAFGFGAEYFREYYEEDPWSWRNKLAVLLGNTWFGSGIPPEQYYEMLLLDYFHTIDDSGYEVELCNQYLYYIDTLLKNARKVLKSFEYKYIISKADLKLLEEEICDYEELLDSLYLSSKYVNTETIENLITKVSGYIDKLKKYDGAFETFKQISNVLTLFPTIEESVMSYSYLLTDYYCINDNLYIMQYISDNSDDSSLRNAANSILAIYENDFNMAEILSVITNETICNAGVQYVTNEIRSYLSKGTFVGKVNQVFVDVMNKFFNVSVVAKESYKTYAIATISNLLSEDLDETLLNAKYTDHFIILYNENDCIRKLSNLINARKFGEKTYQTLMNAIPKWIKELEDYEDLFTNVNIAYLERMYDKYNRKEQ